MNTKIHSVTDCPSCPFLEAYDTDGGDLQFAACHAPGSTGDGVLFDDVKLPDLPPDWCPLREASVLVVLAVP